MSFEIAIWIVPLLLAGLGAWSPRYGLVGFAAVLPLFGSPPGGPYLAALDVAALAVILTSLRAIRKSYPGEPDWRHSGVEWPVVAWVVVAAASMIPLVYHPPSTGAGGLAGLLRVLPNAQSSLPLYTWRALANLLLGVGLFVAVRRAFAGRSLRPLGFGLAGGVGLLIVLGLAEFAGLLGLDAYRVIGDPLYDTRLHSLFFHSGWLAEYLVLALPFAAACLLLGGRWSRLAGFLLIGLGALTLIFTQQRGAWVTAIAQAVALPILLSRQPGGVARWRWVAAGLLVALVAAGGLIGYLRPELAEPVQERVKRIGDLSGRTPLWGSAAELTRVRPLLGWGVGSFATAYDQLHPPGSRQSWRYRGTAHNLYLHTLAERGLLGLLALTSLGWALVHGLREVRDSRGRRERQLGVALSVTLLGFGVYGLVQYLFYLKNVELLVWLLVGAASLLMAGAPPSGAKRMAQVICVLALVLVPWRWARTEPLESVYDATYGIHEFERRSNGGGLRWIEGRAMMRQPWRGRVLRLEIVDGHPKAGARDVELVLRVDGREVWRGEAPDTWQPLEIELGEPAAESVAIGLEVSPTFRPAFDYRSWEDLEPSRDIRELGIAIRGFGWEDLVEGRPESDGGSPPG